MNPGKLSILLAACFLFAAISLYGQHGVVGGFEKVTGTQTLQWPTFSVSGNGHFVNTGRVNFARVVTLTNDGGISELSNGQQQAFYGNPCNASSGTSGLNVFGNEVPQTTINGSAPLRMYSVLLDRNIQLENEWQIVGPFHFYSGRVNTDRSNPGHFLHVLQGGSINGASNSLHINGYAAFTGNGSFTLPVGDGQKLRQIQITGNCQGTVKAAYFSVNPNTAVLPAGAPFTTSARDSGVAMVSSREYWDVNGIFPTQITLYFDNASQLTAIASSLSQIVIAGWNGSKWVNLGNAASTGTLAGGSVTSRMLVPDQYQAYTFASTCSAVLASASGTNLQTLCYNAALAPIEFSTIGAIGISSHGIPGANGLPDGVTAAWSNNKVTISGTPLQPGSFQFNIPLSGCGGVSVSGTLTVTPLPSPSITFSDSVLTCSQPSVSLTASGGLSYSWTNSLGTGGTVSISSPGTYTVTVTGSNGCSSTRSISISESKASPIVVITNLSGGRELLTCAFNAINVEAKGGSSYVWSGGLGTNANVFITAPGNYMVTVTGLNGCTSTGGISISQNTMTPEAEINLIEGTTLNCIRSTINVQATGGVSYVWSGGLGTNANASITAPGNYTVTVTGLNGCRATRDITVTRDTISPVAGIINLSGRTTLTCSTPLVTLEATGGIRYSWSGGLGADANVSITAPGDYLVTVTGQNGCRATGAISITRDTASPVVGITSLSGGTVLNCTLNTINVQATGVGTYAWSRGLGNNATAAVTSPGTYTVTVTGLNGCRATGAISITRDTASPTAGITNLSGRTVLNCTSSVVNVQATGGGTYAWSGGLGTNATATISVPGTYVVTVRSLNGCSATRTITITQDTTTPVAEIKIVSGGGNVLTCTVTEIELQATGGVGYVWSGGLGANSTATVTSSGRYTVTVTGENGCRTTRSTTVTEDLTAPIARIENQSGSTVLTCSRTAINVLATGGQRYSWGRGLGSTAAATITAGGRYSVTVTGSNGCTSILAITVTQDTVSPVARISSPEGTVLTCSRASLPLVAGGGINYEWGSSLGTMEAIAVSVRGSYTVTVTGSNGCRGIAGVVITEDKAEPDGEITSPGGGSLTCSRTSLTLRARGGIRYRWGSGLAEGESLTVTQPGFYVVTVTGANGCTDTAGIVVLEDKALPFAEIVNGPASLALTCGQPSVILRARGGAAYFWSGNLGTGDTLKVKDPGTYTVSVSGANGCVATASVTVTADSARARADIAVQEVSGRPNDNVICSGESVRLEASGGTTYKWNTGAMEKEVSQVIRSTTVFSVVVRKENGCVDSAQVRIVSNPVLAITKMVRNTCAGGATGTIALSVTGGQPAYGFLWSNGRTDREITGLTAGVYGVTVLDSNLCIAKDSAVVLGATAAPLLELSAPAAVCVGSVAVVGLRASQAMAVRYSIGSGSVQTLNANGAGVETVGLGTVNATTVIRILSATSTETGCGVSVESLVRTVEAVTAPAVFADNANTCSDVPFNVAVRFAGNDTRPALFDWEGTYGGLLGGVERGQGLAVGRDGISERLRNASTGVIQAWYRIVPYVLIEGSRCNGQPYTLGVRVQPEPTLGTILPQEACSDSPFSIPLVTNVANASIAWTRSDGAVRGLGNILDVVVNTTDRPQEVTYRVEVSAGGCPGAKAGVTVRVRPLPKLVLTAPGDACKGFADLTQASITAGSDAGLQFTYWRDRNLSIAVPEPQNAPAGLYFIAGRDGFQCASSGSIRVQAAIRLQVASPEPVCRGRSVDLTQAEITAGSDANLFYTYWLDAAATRALTTPFAAPAGRYYIKAEATGNARNCFSLLPVEVKELLPELLTETRNLQICSGTEFRFSPQSSVPGSLFEWRREANTGIAAPEESGTGAISESLALSGSTGATVRYSYRLRAPGCSQLGAETGSFIVAVLPKPELSVVERLEMCAPTQDLNELVSNKAGLAISFSLDMEGVQNVSAPTVATVGRYFVRGTSPQGCTTVKEVQIRSKLAENIAPGEVTVCPPATASLEAYAEGAGLTGKFRTGYFSDLGATQRVAVPGSVGEGTYYLLLEGKDDTLSGCKSVVPVQVRSGVATMDSPLAVEEHCGGSMFNYTPTSRTPNVRFRWGLTGYAGRPDTVSGEGPISLLLENDTDSTFLARFRINAVGSSCPAAVSSYLLEVPVLPKSELASVKSIFEKESGDLLEVGINLVRPVGIARLNWTASYGSGLEGGLGRGTGVQFGPRAISEQLFNFGDSTSVARYTLMALLTGAKACAGATLSFEVRVAPEPVMSPAGISGILQTNFGSTIEGAELRLSGPSQAIQRISSAQGQFSFSGIRPRYDYSLTPQLDKDPVNGVTTRDMIALQQHLIGKKPLLDPYQLIAADINNSRSVTVADAIALRKIILGVESGFPSNRSWRFVDKDYAFPSPLLPWTPPFPELKNYNDIDGEQTGNFIGVKIGDITGDARANSQGGLAPRSGAALLVITENPEMRKGQRLVLPIRVGGTNNWDGAQFTLAFDRKALRIVVSESFLSVPDYLSIFEASGLLTCSWAQPLKPGETIMALHFEVLKDGKPEEWIDLNSRITAAEGYIDTETRPLLLQFEDQGTEIVRPRSMQNYPNPFTGQTSIPFWLPSEDRIWLKVYDLTGKLVLEREGIFGKGRHSFDLIAPDLKEGNAWYYQIGGTDWVETRQMMRF